MISFKKMFESKKSFLICLFEGVECRWPIIEGWTQKQMTGIPYNDQESTTYMIEYFNDKKNFYVSFHIEENEYNLDSFLGKWTLTAWGKTEQNEFKSVKQMKSILKKTEILYENLKTEGKKKIPNIPEWGKKVNDYEISYLKKVKNRTVTVKILDIHGFIRNFSIGYNIRIYNDSLDDRVVENAYYKENNRAGFKSMISQIDDEYFKK